MERAALAWRVHSRPPTSAGNGAARQTAVHRSEMRGAVHRGCGRIAPRQKLEADRDYRVFARDDEAAQKHVSGFGGLLDRRVQATPAEQSLDACSGPRY